MGTVRLDGEVKTIQLARKETAEKIVLVARVLLEFTPTEKGIAELQDLMAMQELPVNVTITAQQFDLPITGKLHDAILGLAPKKGSSVESVTLSTGDASVTLTAADGERTYKAAKK